MKQQFYFVFLLVCCSLMAFQVNKHMLIDPENFSSMDFQQYCEFHSYPVQKYRITTEDNYHLTLYRIQGQNSAEIVPKEKIAFLQHGLLDTAFTFIANEQELSIGFNLANEGVDVWIGNARGNFQSRSHEYLSPDESDYWNFSLDQMVEYDLPAIFEFIAQQTYQMQTKIHYIGHSMGTMMMFAALSEVQIYDRIKPYLAHFIALNPAAFFQNTDSIPIAVFKNFKRLLNLDLNYSGDHSEILGRGAIFTNLVSTICVHNTFFCKFFHGVLGNLESNHMENEKRLHVVYSNSPSGTSKKNMAHFQQLMHKNQFTKFDYGIKQNLIIYGKEYPDQYNLQNITYPNITLLFGLRDQLSSPKDTLSIIERLKNVTNLQYYSYDCGHQTLLWGKEMPHMDIIQQTILQD